MKLSTDAAKKVFSQCLLEHKDELATAFGVCPRIISDIASWKRTSKEESSYVIRKFSFRDNPLLIAYVKSDVSDSQFTSIEIGLWGGCQWYNLHTYYFSGGEDIEKQALQREKDRWEEQQRQKRLATEAITSSAPSDVLQKFRQNPVVVRLVPEGEKEPDSLIGRIIFYPAEDCYDGVVFGKNSKEFDDACLNSGKECQGDIFAFDCGPEEEGHLSDREDCYTGLHDLFEDFGGRIDIGACENHHVVRLIEGIAPSDLWLVIRDRLVRCGAVEKH